MTIFSSQVLLYHKRRISVAYLSNIDPKKILCLTLNSCIKRWGHLKVVFYNDDDGDDDDDDDDDAGPYSSVGSVEDLRTVGRWFDPRLGQYSLLELMIVIATGFIPLSPLSVVSTMFMWESSQWLGRNIVQSTV